jgi:uncharacterized protein (DUF1697 family)
MTTYVALLRGINVGGNKMVAMAALRDMLTKLGFEDAKTLLQSGNAVFRGKAMAPAKLEALLEAETKKRLGVACDYHVRTAAELHAAIDANPLKKEAAKDPSHLLVSFFKAPIDAAKVKAAQAAVAAIAGPEIVRGDGRHLYVFFPQGIGTSKAHAPVGKAIGVNGTARNWNTVLKLQQMVAD